MSNSRFLVLSARAATRSAQELSQTVLGLGIALLVVLALSLATGCAPTAPGVRKQPAMVEGDLKTSTQPGPVARPGSVVTEVTLKKAEILDRDFLYGADLQYSSVGDLKYSLITQVLAIGHYDARFRILESPGAAPGARARLQLIADQRTSFESDINHPERLIHEFSVVAQTSRTITIQIDRGSSVLAAMLGQGPASQLRTSWVRSVQYEAQGNYLMFETSIEDMQGNVIEFMESLFPRETLVAPALARGFKPLLNDRDREPLSARYRFISNASVFLDLPGATNDASGSSRVLTQVAARYGYHPEKSPDPIRWFVTPNLPDAYLGDIRTGVEAWNRYSRQLWGKDLVRFEGKLPAGVKVGDPRYNVISWDSVAEAGAAYESQAADLRTGLQSHSLIYLPNAWLNIGRNYWRDGDLSVEDLDESSARGSIDDGGLARQVRGRKILGRGLPVSCIHDPLQKLAQKLPFDAAWGDRVDVETFARELLKGVLFHEVGHALGLSHNFKASLTWNPEDPGSPITTSVMDYNQYALERTIFRDVDSADGPILEYDRQILSVLYNDGAELKLSDPVLPACDDDEADRYVGGPDPLCVRYDSGSEPTAQLLATIGIVSTKANRLGSMDSLAVSLGRMTDELGDPARVVDLPAASAAVGETARKMAGLVNFYYIAGAQSLSSATRAAVKSLYVPAAATAPEKMDEMRARALEGIDWVLGQKQFSADTRQALDHVATEVSGWLLKTPVFAGLGSPGDPSKPADPRREAFDALMTALSAVRGLLESSEDASTLARLRMSVLGALVRREGAPFYFSVSDAGVLDVEARALAWLEAAAVRGTAMGWAFIERARAIASLKTFEGTEAGELTLSRVRDSLTQELRTVRNAQEREKLRKLLVITGGRGP